MNALGAMASTVDQLDAVQHAARRDHRWRVAGLLLLVAFVAMGASGVLGARTATLRAADQPLEVELTYPAITRPGLAASWELAITDRTGFRDPIEVTVERSWLAMFDQNAISPDPQHSTTDITTTTWIFDPPEGTTLVVSLDLRAEPGVQSGRSGSVRVTAGDSSVTVDYSTAVLP